MSTLQSLLAILGLACALAGALPDVPAREDFVRWAWASATVLGDYVYVDGGELTQKVDGKLFSTTPDQGKMNSLLTHSSICSRLRSS
jgi:hypothetical protein